VSSLLATLLILHVYYKLQVVNGTSGSLIRLPNTSDDSNNVCEVDVLAGLACGGFRAAWLEAAAGLSPSAVDDPLQLLNHHIQQFHVLRPLILGLNPEFQVDFNRDNA
jgi:hypothetical protein